MGSSGGAWFGGLPESAVGFRVFEERPDALSAVADDVLADVDEPGAGAVAHRHLEVTAADGEPGSCFGGGSKERRRHAEIVTPERFAASRRRMARVIARANGDCTGA